MLDRFQDAQWIHGVPPTGTVRHETGVYGTLACGHLTIVAECGGHSCNSETMREDQEANARLIAAAPTMREALVDLIEQIEAYERLHGANTCAIDPDGARVAIAKAEGRA